jgi:hypothetical protein
MGVFDIIENIRILFSGKAGNAKAVSPQADKNGVDWNQNGKPDFIIDKDDPRYIECEKLAHTLKEKIDPETGKTFSELLSPSNPNPPTKEKIIEIEYDITTSLHTKVREQFGGYNKYLTGLSLEQMNKLMFHPSLHGDYLRMDTSEPVRLSDFEKDEFMCRHYSPLANILLTEAGMSVVRLPHLTASMKAKDDDKLMIYHIGPHDVVMSEMTGNIIDFVAKNSERSYKKAITPASVPDFNNGATIIADDGREVIFIRNIPLETTEAKLALEARKQELNGLTEEFNKGNKEALQRLLNKPENHESPHIPVAVKNKAQQAVSGEKPEFSGSEFSVVYNGPATPRDITAIAH